ncbi:SPRY domain containing protein [Parasponia andersonii]|uniref:SPRY domain containing protein n=1 Tax=Parasponia andersonii TaxID=3476 RepID=A0A2P5CVG1_PARAD|nr:SPRY domain containing protein [Parasponia andersonii]
MLERTHVIVGIVCFGVLSILIILLLWRRYYHKSEKKVLDLTSSTTRTERLQSGIIKLHQQEGLHHNHHHHHQVEFESKRVGNYYVFRRGVSGKPLFSWSDHPSLITDAVENGWSRFAFTGYTSSPSTRSRLLGLCPVGELKREAEPETSWEICQESADFMQKIRLNPGLKKALNAGNNPSMAAASLIRTALPLPGPPLGNSSFPQEAYFEITILFCRSGDENQSSINGKVKEGEKTKLIRENSNAKANSESLVHVTSSNRVNKIEELKLGGRDDGKSDAVMLSVGLTAGGSLPLKLPGSYSGSIGFNSDGSVYVDGIKLAFESEKAEWGRVDKVIGCGFDPRQKKVFFTVDSEMIHLIHCKSEEFGAPLYPTLAANGDVLVLVNFGQSVFKYGPANAQRTPNPCFVGPVVNSPAAIGYDDSKELFSMGRIDSQWLNRSTTRGGSQNPGNPNRASDFDEESEADLFEIVLDSCGRSPNVVS